jgi:hypothetical protein
MTAGSDMGPPALHHMTIHIVAQEASLRTTFRASRSGSACGAVANGMVVPASLAAV